MTTSAARRSRLGIAALLLAGASLAAEAVRAGPGHAPFAAPAPHHGRALEGRVLYPPAPGGAPERIGENAVFHGVDVVHGAPVAPGRHPLVLLSHGLGGHVGALAWLAAGLAERGAIVVAMNHPGSTAGDLDLGRGLDHWTRAQDLRAALDGVLADPALAPHVDTQRIYAAGFSYGGWTALSVGGLRGDLAGYRRFCAEAARGPAHCRALAAAGISLEGRDAERWDAPWKDPRIAAVAAIDPGLHAGLGPEDAADLVAGVLLIGLGEGGDRMILTDFSERGTGLAALLPDATVVTIAPAAHVTALPPCKPEGAALLAAEGDDPVCTDPPGTDRAAAHRAIVAAIAAQFGLD
jgi:predicted dienelactone hydrolase